jgi:dihydroorotate dehydrogenase (fumarate)
VSADLRTRYLGLALKNPLVAGASPLSDDLDGVRRLEDGGVAAIVLRSLFEEQIDGEALATSRAFDEPTESYGEALTFLPNPDDFILGPQAYLDHVRRVVEHVGVPVIGSLNGTTSGGWLRYAKLIEEAGAAALELNLYRVPEASEGPGAAIEERSVAMVREVAAQVRIPVAVKLSPYHTSLGDVARRMAEAGARGLVLFNRFFEPDIDTEALEYVSALDLSEPRELRARLRWIALLHGQVDANLAVTGGVHSALDVVKSVLAGADAVQLVSVLLRRGPHHAPVILAELASWLTDHGYPSIASMRGTLSASSCPNPAVLGRANYARMLQTWRAAP